MFELLIFGAGAAVGALALAIPYHRAAIKADEAQADLATLTEARDSLALSLRAAEMSRDKAISTGIIEVNRLSDENTQLQREKGRIEAELRAANQSLAKFERKRGKGGRFVRKAEPAPKPIPCA